MECAYYNLSALNLETFFSGLAVSSCEVSFDCGVWDMLDWGSADERIAGGRSGRVGGRDEEGRTVGGTAGLPPPCCDATGKDGESTINENGNVADDEAGAENGCRSYTRGAIAIAGGDSNFGDDRASCDIGVIEGDRAS